MTNTEESSRAKIARLEGAVEMLGRELQSANRVITEASRQNAGTYEERDMLIAALSKVFPSHITRHVPVEGEDWDPAWLNVICVHLPTGIAGWHVHAGELSWFDHLRGVELPCEGYDGYDTMEKYKKLSRVPVLWLQGFYIGDHRDKGQSARIDFPGPDGPGLPDTRPGS